MVVITVFGLLAFLAAGLGILRNGDIHQVAYSGVTSLEPDQEKPVGENTTKKRASKQASQWATIPLPDHVPAAPGEADTLQAAMLSVALPKQWPNDEWGFENLALRKTSKSRASSVIAGYDIHKIEHLNDGKLGNDWSWIAEQNPCWAEIDIGDTFWVYRVAVGSDSSGKYQDRGPTRYSILVATEYDENSDAETWKKVAPGPNPPAIQYRTEFCFVPVQARYVRIAIEQTSNNAAARIDEFEVFGRETEISLDEIGLPDKITVTDDNLIPAVLPIGEALPVDEVKLLAEWKTTLVDEEYAWLKAFGRADIDPGLTHTPYPTQKHPIRVPEDRTTLVSIEETPVLDVTLSDPVWNKVSTGTVRVAKPGNFEQGAAVEYKCRVMISGEFLYVAMETNRLLSTHLAVFQTEKGGGVVALGHDGQLVWRDYKNGENFEDVPLDSAVDMSNGRFVFRVPLSRLPEIDAGLVFRAGIGGRYTPNNGHPIIFHPGTLAVTQLDSEKGKFALRLTNYGNETVRILGTSVPAGQSVDVVLDADDDPIGWQKNIAADDFDLHLFQYDPVKRSLMQFREMLDRVPADAVPEYRQNIDRAKTALKLLETKNRQLKQESFDKKMTRDLFYEVRKAKREFFFADPAMQEIETILFEKRYPLHPSHNYSDIYDSTWREGGGIYTLQIPKENGRFVPEHARLTELFRTTGMTRHPAANFDVSKIYFTNRPSFSEYWHIMEMNPDGSGLRRLTDGPFHDLWPCPLPDGDLCFVTTRCKQKYLCWEPQASVLFRMNTDGENMTPLSFANLTEFAPSVARDGRILWTRSEYLDKGADYGHTLWYIRPDGTNPELTFGNTIVLPQGYANGREVPGSNEVSCVMISHFGDLNGPLTLLNLDQGRFNPDAIHSLTPEVPWPGFWARVETFREPFPIATNLFLVSHSSRDRFALFVLDRFGNREMITMDDTFGCMCPTPLKKRPAPPMISSVVDPELAQRKVGVFAVQDVYRGIEHVVPRGSAKYLRVCQELRHHLEQYPDGSFRASHQPYMEFYASPVDLVSGPYGWTSYVAKGDLGLVEIEQDGSVGFEAPAESVLFFELLDEHFNEIQRMRSVVQLQPGESRSCIGCHEDRKHAAPPVFAGAMHASPKKPASSPWGVGPFDFANVVQPVLDRHCVSCHNENDEHGFDLTGKCDENHIPASFKTIIRNGWVHHFDWGYQAGVPTKAEPYTFGTFRSKIWPVLKDHYDVRLSPDEERAVKCWTDLSCPLWPDYIQRSLRKP